MNTSESYDILILPTEYDVVRSSTDVLNYLAPQKNNVVFVHDLPNNTNIQDHLYYQIYIMKYALSCQKEYYLIWDGNCLPCHNVSMLNIETGIPYMDYFDYDDNEFIKVVSILLPGFKRVLPQSFATGHMLIRTDIMRNLISDIERNASLTGNSFTDKIINCCNTGEYPIPFNIYVLYGIYTSIKHPSKYRLRSWSILLNGSSLLSPDQLNDNDLLWLSKSFDVVIFNNRQSPVPEYAELFGNEYYRKKLTPRQITDAIFSSSEATVTNIGDEIFSPESRLKYLEPDTYRVYEQLGDDLIMRNTNQAYLCYENAAFLCNYESDLMRIASKKRDLYDSGNVNVNKTAIIIISYNNKSFTLHCLESIYTNCDLNNCLVMVFDNGSTDGSQEWLAVWGESHNEAVVILNDSNLGFAGGNNACCRYLPDGYDVFYLNNDTRIPANALFWMRMALYSSDDVGGVGAVQNYAKGDQLEDVFFDLPEQYVEYGARHNIYEPNPYEEQSKICGFAMLIAREIYDKTGGFDERFNPGFLDDDDLSLQIRSLGKKLILCQNAFIYHAGSQSFRKRDDVNELFRINREKCIEKWGFDPTLYAAMSENEYKYIMSLEKKGFKKESHFSLLHIGCGCGNMLGHIHYLYPNATLAGIEENIIARKFAISCIPIYPSIEDLPMLLNDYDVVVKGLG